MSGVLQNKVAIDGSRVPEKRGITGNPVGRTIQSPALSLQIIGEVVEQGGSVVKGNQLVVDLATNRSQMTGGRVKGLFTPSQKTP